MRTTGPREQKRLMGKEGQERDEEGRWVCSKTRGLTAETPLLKDLSSIPSTYVKMLIGAVTPAPGGLSLL